MKILRTILVFIMITILSITLTITISVNTFASSSINANNRKIANVAVLLYSFDDLYIMKLKQGLEEIQKENTDKVNFSFFDGKNNISIQNETFDSLLKSNIDLFIVNLADAREKMVEGIILKAKQSNVPIILMTIDPKIASKVSKYYDKVVFTSPQTESAGIAEGKIIVDLWNDNKQVIDKNGDNILQYILLEGKANSPTAIDRTRSVISTINDAGIKMGKIASTNANWSKELAKESISNLLLRYDGKIEAIISNNDAMAIGAVEAL